MLKAMRAVLLAFLVAALIEMPVLAAPAKPLGVVTYAEHARLGAAVVAGGTTIFAGDRVSTDSAGLMRLRLGATQVYLLGGSAVAFSAAGGASSAALLRGTVGFASAGADGIEILANDARIRAKTSQPTHGQVALVGPHELVVTSYRGAVEISLGDETLTVPAATSYRVLLQDPPQEPEGAGKEAAKRRRMLGIVASVAVAGALAGIIAWRASVSPSGP